MHSFSCQISILFYLFSYIFCYSNVNYDPLLLKLKYVLIRFIDYLNKNDLSKNWSNKTNKQQVVYKYFLI